MKRPIVILFISIIEIFSATSYAEEKEIEAIERYWYEDIRTIPCVPTITHDGNIFYIYSDKVLEDLHITIKDFTGTVLYSDIVTVSNIQYYSFTIDNIKEGDFIIELRHKDKYLYGYFNISQ